MATMAPDAAHIKDHEALRRETRRLLLEALHFPEDYLAKEEEKRALFQERLGIHFPPSGRIVWEPMGWKHSTEGATTYTMDGVSLLARDAKEWLSIPAPVQGGSMGQILKIPSDGLFPINLLTMKDYFRVQGLDPNLREVPLRIVLSIAFEDWVFMSDYCTYTSCFSVRRNKGGGGPNQGSGRFYALTSDACLLLREEDSLISPSPEEDAFPLLPKKVARRIAAIHWGRKQSFAYLWRPYGILQWGIIPPIALMQENGNLTFVPGVKEATISPGSCEIPIYVDGVTRLLDGHSFHLTTSGTHVHPPRWEIGMDRDSIPCSCCKKMLGGKEKRFSGWLHQEDVNITTDICSGCFQLRFVQCAVCMEYVSRGAVFFSPRVGIVCGRQCGRLFHPCVGGCGAFDTDEHLLPWKGELRICPTCRKEAVATCMGCGKELSRRRLREPNRVGDEIYCTPCARGARKEVGEWNPRGALVGDEWE